MQEQYPHDTYEVDIPCYTSDDEEVELELEVTLLDKSIRPRKFRMTQAWLDNYYRPALMKKVEIHIRKLTRDEVHEKGAELMQELQQIANDLFETIHPPQ